MYYSCIFISYIFIFLLICKIVFIFYTDMFNNFLFNNVIVVLDTECVLEAFISKENSLCAQSLSHTDYFLLHHHFRQKKVLQYNCMRWKGLNSFPLLRRLGSETLKQHLTTFHNHHLKCLAYPLEGTHITLTVIISLQYS